jgi:hypothetical protein
MGLRAIERESNEKRSDSPGMAGSIISAGATGRLAHRRL